MVLSALGDGSHPSLQDSFQSLTVALSHAAENMGLRRTVDEVFKKLEQDLAAFVAGWKRALTFRFSRWKCCIP